MFKQRLITACLLIPLVLWILYAGYGWLFMGATLLLLVIMGWEWLPMIPINSRIFQVFWIILLVLLMWPVYYALPYVLILDLCLWFGVLIAVLSYPKLSSGWGHPPVLIVTGWLCLTTLMSVLLKMYSLGYGADRILYVLFLVWATDTGAYLAGRAWGKHQLIPHVSPGKTIEGMLGGVVLAHVVIGLGYMHWHPQSLWCWWMVGIGTILMSILGDLFVSMLKRRSHVKDTGCLLPGHGGLLDRLDSLLSALPFFFFSYGFCGC